jgi:hypothetical protein
MWLATKSNQKGPDLYLQGLNLFLVLIFGAAILGSLHLSKYQR